MCRFKKKTNSEYTLYDVVIVEETFYAIIPSKKWKQNPNKHKKSIIGIQLHDPTYSFWNMIFLLRRYSNLTRVVAKMVSRNVSKESSRDVNIIWSFWNNLMLDNDKKLIHAFYIWTQIATQSMRIVGGVC